MDPIEPVSLWKLMDHIPIWNELTVYQCLMIPARGSILSSRLAKEWV
jgi:hypothetical protein